MAALRQASAYSKRRARPYTRKSARRNKAYIKVVPFSKIVKFTAGVQQDFDSGKHGFAIRLVSGEHVQIRDNALEAGRMLLHKLLESQIPGEYFMRVKVYPHHLLREHKTAAGAGADRLSTGMSHAFGVVIGRAAFVKPNQEIFFVSTTDEKAARIARSALQTIKPKVPGSTRIVFEKIVNPRVLISK